MVATGTSSRLKFAPLTDNNVPNAHAVYWLVARHEICALTDHTPKLVLLLATTESTNSISWGIPLHHLVNAHLAQIWIQTSLNNRKQVLFLGLLMCLDASVQPMMSNNALALVSIIIEYADQKNTTKLQNQLTSGSIAT